jgi:serine/threonine-protein kinase
MGDDSGVAIGTVLAGRYRIAGLLGAGGMGRVYRGEHTGIGKPVAVKVLRGALGKNQEAAARFHREAIASGRLHHPNIVSVIDFGVLDGGCLYLVMEALDGEHVGQRLARDKRVPWADALTIVRGVLLGLRHAHDRGVVHRDVKPDNIFLAVKGDAIVVKLFDFGIAKLYAGVSDDQMATRAGITVGTPAYLSPEQAVGGEITPASDIYSTCIVLYELLVGRAPFESDDALTLLRSHAGAQVPTFRELAPDLRIPPGIEPLVRRGLAKVAGERISAEELLDGIDEILRAHGIAVTPPLARSSQSMGIPLGPHALSTPVPGTLAPSPDFLATPTPFPALRAPTPVPTVEIKRPVVALPPAPRPRRRWIAIVVAAVVVVATVAIALVLLRGEPEPAATQPAVAVPAPPAPSDHDVRLEAALRELQDGASCVARKKAIAKLVELHDGKAIPAIKKARALKANACLRVAADQAVRSLK